MSYKLTDVLPDGWLGPSPRWVLHCIKLAQHAALAFLFVVVFSAVIGTPYFFLSGLLGGMLMYWTILVNKRIHNAPVDRWDWLFDSSFALVTTAGGCFAEHDWLLGSVVLIVAIIFYFTLHTRGTP